MSIRFFITLAIFFGLLVGYGSPRANNSYVSGAYCQRPEVSQFIYQMSSEHHFTPQYLTQVFNQVEPKPQIIRIMTTPHEGLPWYRYRALFLTPLRAKQGSEFGHQHHSILAKAERYYGVPPSIILGILGVETNYGRTQGTYRVIDALSTLAFYYPPRAKYFRGELEQFLLLTRENSWNPLTIRGSYAGAIGQPQFMPTSYRELAIDSSSKGYSDLITNCDDTVMSVANYFKGKGWTKGGLVAVRATVKGQNYRKLAAKEKHTLNELKNYGVFPQNPVHTHEKAYLMGLAGQQGTEYWLIFHNFDVIMRYNTSPRYAMVVYQLGEWIKRKQF